MDIPCVARGLVAALLLSLGMSGCGPDLETPIYSLPVFCAEGCAITRLYDSYDIISTGIPGISCEYGWQEQGGMFVLEHPYPAHNNECLVPYGQTAVIEYYFEDDGSLTVFSLNLTEPILHVAE